MLLILGMLIAVALAAVTIRAIGWLRTNKGWELSKTTGFWAGLAVALVLYTVFRYGTKLPNEIVSGIAIGLGVGMSQGFGGSTKPR